jgi:hypothetical protein
MILKINNVKGFSGEFEVADNKGVPLDKFWRDRLKDAKTDKCVEIIKRTRKKESK